jgi:hypothetical protein
MSGKRANRGSPRLALVGLAIYAVFLIASPFEHHDLLCELKTPQHCTSCTSSQLGANPPAATAPGAWDPADAGQAISIQLMTEGALLSVRTTGRSPPARS